MPACKVCGEWFAKTNPHEELCLKCECALSRLSGYVAPIVHGRWIRPHWKNNNYCCDCSECGGEAMHRDYQWNKNGIYPICPNCGAKMQGQINEKY